MSNLRLCFSHCYSASYSKMGDKFIHCFLHVNIFSLLEYVNPELIKNVLNNFTVITCLTKTSKTQNLFGQQKVLYKSVGIKSYQNCGEVKRESRQEQRARREENEMCEGLLQLQWEQRATVEKAWMGLDDEHTFSLQLLLLCFIAVSIPRQVVLRPRLAPISLSSIFLQNVKSVIKIFKNLSHCSHVMEKFLNCSITIPEHSVHCPILVEIAYIFESFQN